MLISDWKLHYEGFDPIDCKAPCTLFSVLVEEGKIPHPFYGINEWEVTPLALKDCIFTSEFNVDEKILKRNHVELIFKGLDTICSIYLNDNLLGNVKNMHREYCYEVGDILKAGINHLKLDFSSPMEYFRKMDAKHYIYCNDGDTLPGASHLRKPLFESGWDWGPTLPDMGIVRAVELLAYDTDRITGFTSHQKHSPNLCEVSFEVFTKQDSDAEAFLLMNNERLPLPGRKGTIKIENPRLWWVRGYGEQHLYDFTIELVKGGKVLDSITKRMGLRSLSVSTKFDPDKSGREFAFVNNGVKIFAMGANYIPQDSFLTTINESRTQKIVDSAIFANFNCLRVWGGGYYPEDFFYDYCDEKGIMIWQDFMVACANIYLTEEMEEEFRKEATYNVIRLGYHASLGLLCGNNEMEDGVLEWGARNNQLVRDDYIKLYEHILPEISEKYAPDTFYWPSSPSSGGGFDDPANHAKGDTHYWKVWHGGVPFTTYRQEHFRFCSEYGFESFPSIKTIQSFCPEEELNCFSLTMENHQKCKGGNSKILMYLANNYLYPYSFENLVYASQLLQADAIKYGVEHFRRERGYCMGSIYWQFNDCWPVASWSSVDYYGRYKALHYAAKKFYAPVAMGLFLENSDLSVNISNETMSSFKGEIRLSITNNKFVNKYTQTEEIFLKALSSKDVLVLELPKTDKYTEFISVDLFDENGKFIMRQTELLVPPKHFSFIKPGITQDFSVDKEGRKCLNIRSDVFAKGVFIDFLNEDIKLSDNFFDLTNDKPYTVILDTDLDIAALTDTLKIKTVYDIR